MEPEHHPLLAADLFFVVGVDQQGEHDPVDPERRFHHVRQVSLALEIVKIRKIPPRRLLMRREIVTAAGGDAFELRPAKRKFVLDVEGARRVVGEFALAVRPQPQLLLTQAEAEMPAQPFLLPVIEPFDFVRRWHEVFELHQLELA